MTIQRQYSLPNCKLILEGLTNENPAESPTARPLVSVVTNVECYLSGLEKPLVGGRDFLESLMKAVSDYAQDYLSGIPHAARRDRQDASRAVQFHRVEKNLHRLSIQPHVMDGVQAASFPPPTELDLTTVQLFDLVEAIDQLFADAQTVPELTLHLKALPKRAVAAQEPVTKRALPAAIGVSSLAAAALALFFLPIPEVRRPEPTQDSTEQAPSEVEPVAASPGNSPPSPQADSASSAAIVSPEASPDANSSVASPTASSPTASPAGGTTSSPTSTDLEAILASSNEILDPAELERLTGELQGELYAAWDSKPPPTFTEPLEYRVGVNEDGQIVGYKYVNDAAINYLPEIPLSDVQLAAAAANAETPDIAQFLVVFRPEGVLEVSPWYGLPTGASEQPAAPESP
ncbi:MAG: hypothetical protein Kow00121_48660 [Elainellaceae cyanobacterium]